MEITKEEVLRIAKLAKLRYTEEEAARLAADFVRTDALFHQLQALPAACSSSVCAEDAAPLREDIVAPSFSRQDILKNAPCGDEEGFLVPKVFEQESL